MIILLVLNLQMTQTETAAALSVQLMKCVKESRRKGHIYSCWKSTSTRVKKKSSFFLPFVLYLLFLKKGKQFSITKQDNTLIFDSYARLASNCRSTPTDCQTYEVLSLVTGFVVVVCGLYDFFPAQFSCILHGTLNCIQIRFTDFLLQRTPRVT